MILRKTKKANILFIDNKKQQNAPQGAFKNLMETQNENKNL